MSLTITEATAVNTLIKHLTGAKTSTGDPIRTRDQAIDALVVLTQSAYKALKAGYTPDDAREDLTTRWPNPHSDTPRRVVASLGHAIDTHAALEQPIGHVPTPAGLEYLATRRQQHPRIENL